ncbi:hypothetical protein Solca_2544 [Sporocytophaga myxococcoides]|uniref:HlyD family secretion protein n=1 Tax=Sporocytophaga myxococcoides TaxID=153721 RepID=A0A098L9B6_9BACT|nr:hypothetical protein Solca_2544 [Sporocytophaga myxococcoides]
MSCSKQTSYDATGTFEAVETIISSEGNGVIKEFELEEGQDLSQGQYVGYIDTIQLFLKMKQLEAQIKSTISQKPDISRQIASLKAQIKAAEKDKERFTDLAKEDAIPQKQLDDITAQVDVLHRQLDALYSSLNITSKGITLQADPITIQIAQVEDQLRKSIILNPVKGTVLSKYVEANEIASVGKPLYKIADLSTIILRAYITGSQLPIVKLNQKVKVLVYADKGSYKEYSGMIEWISSTAEFTPKTIQTKDERANLVYAIKIRVKNDGYLKIGMYGEVKL